MYVAEDEESDEESMDVAEEEESVYVA